MEIKESKDALWYALLALISLIMIWKAVILLWLRPKKIERLLRQQGLKGNPYKPILGDVIDLIKYRKTSLSSPINFSDHHRLSRVMAFFHQTMEKHGKNCFMWAGPTPWLLIADPEKMKEILYKYEDFQKPNLPFIKLLLVGLFGLEGDQWAKHRKIINPAFHVEKLKKMVDAMYQSCSTMMSAWDEKVSREGSVEMDVVPFLVKLTSDVISRAAFGSSYEQGKRIFDLQAEHVCLTMGFQVLNYIPGWRYFPTKTNRRVIQICKEVEELLTRMVDSRKKELEAKRRNTKDDLLGILLESNMKEIKEHGNEKATGLTTAEVVQECKLFYLAGSETTSSLLVWALVLLSKHRIWQERARAEVLQVFGKDAKPNVEGFSRTKVVNMILYEVLRLCPPVYMLMRKANKEMNLGEWLIPAGTEILLPIYELHQDCNIWGKDAKEFNPERFCDGVFKATKGQGAFLPFSTGPRICIGQNFALLEARFALTMILQRFSFELSTTYTHAPCASLTLQPQYGANLILHKL